VISRLNVNSATWWSLDSLAREALFVCRHSLLFACGTNTVRRHTPRTAGADWRREICPLYTLWVLFTRAYSCIGVLVRSTAWLWVGCSAYHTVLVYGITSDCLALSTSPKRDTGECVLPHLIVCDKHQRQAHSACTLSLNAPPKLVDTPKRDTGRRIRLTFRVSESNPTGNPIRCQCHLRKLCG